MNLIQKIKDYLFKGKKDTVKQSHNPNDLYLEKRAIIAQKQEDNKWSKRIIQKATERYVSIYVNKDHIPIIDCTRYCDTYTVYHEKSAMYKDGIEAAIDRELQWMLTKANKVPKGTIPSS